MARVEYRSRSSKRGRSHVEDWPETGWDLPSSVPTVVPAGRGHRPLRLDARRLLRLARLGADDGGPRPIGHPPLALGGAERPSTGAIVGRLHQGRPGSLPSYVILGDPLHQGKQRVIGEGGGTLGSAYDPLRLRYEPGAGVRLPDAQLPESLTAARLEARWDLRHHLNRDLATGTSPAAKLDSHYELAHTLITSRQGLSA